MRILVTGGAGYIGSHAARYFREHGHAVSVLDSLELGHRTAVPADELFVADLSDQHKVEQILRDRRIEAVVHFAAYSQVGESVQHPLKYYRNNTVNTILLLEVMRKAGVNKMVFSSTCATYGIPERVPMDETTPQKPINPYGRSKLMIEWALADAATAHGLGFAALRYFNASGAHPSGEIGEDHTPETHLIPLILQVALGQRDSIQVFGTDYPTPDGTCIRDYIHVDDLASAHLLALEKLEPGKGLYLNLGTGKGYSVREVIKACEEVTDRKIKVVESPRRAGDPPALVATSGKATEVLGWKPAYTNLRQIVVTAWRWHQAHPKGYGQ